MRKLVYQNEKSRISRVDSSMYKSILRSKPGDHPPKIVAMKVLAVEYPTQEKISLFYTEYEILKGISHPNIRKVYARTKYQNKHTLFMEYVEGSPIRDHGKHDVDDFFPRAIKIVSALLAVHSCHIVHKDVNANNILITDTNDVKLIDFGMAAKISQDFDDDPPAPTFQGTPRYISPEQSGLLNRVVDHRSDLYSVGITFYFMLTGSFPFNSHDIDDFAWMHRHQTATPIVDIDPKIPIPLSNLVKRLMMKKPEDRYQSTTGLLYDLETMYDILQREGTIPASFSVGQKDFSGRVRAPRKLHGRRDEIAILSSSIARVRSGGGLEAILIGGAPGTGKSSLANELRTFMVEDNEQQGQQQQQRQQRQQSPFKGYFVSGKYDRLQKDEPYSAILRALNELCCDVLASLSSRCDELDSFRKTIQEAVGDEGKVLTDFVPKLRDILGDQPDMPDIGLLGTKSRFKTIFCKFVKAMGAAVKGPIVLFMDDLQWAEAGSLDLLSGLVMDVDIRNVMLVGAYRNDLVVESHPLTEALSGIEKQGGIVKKIEIKNLSKENTIELVCESLTATQNEILPLADLIYQKTSGNAFFAFQFVRSLWEENLLLFCRDELRWKWDMEKLTMKAVAENVAELIIKKLMKLSIEVRDALTLASCLGSHFDLSTLRLITGEPDMLKILETAVLRGMITVVSHKDKKFRFAHDKIQQAVYSLIDESDRDAFHLKIGRMLRQKLEQAELDDMLFVVVNQLNSGILLIEDIHERIDLACLNLSAGKRARFSSAFAQASGFFASGVALLQGDDDRWMKHYELCLELYGTAAEIRYSLGDHEGMNEMLEQVFANANSILDQVGAYHLKIKFLRSQNRINEALETGLHILNKLGETTSAEPHSVSIIYNFLKTKYLLWNKDDEAILSLPDATDQKITATMQIMLATLTSSLRTNQKLSALVALRMIQLTLDHGATKFSAYGLAMYGALLIQFNDNVEEGYRFAQLALRVLDRYQAKELYSVIYLIVYGAINPRKENVNLSVPQLQEAAKIGMITGEVECALYNARFSCIYALLIGKPLDEVENEIKLCCENILKHNQEHIMMTLKPVWQSVINMKECLSTDPTILLGAVLNEEEVQKYMKIDNSFPFIFYFMQVTLSYYFLNYERAAKMCEKCNELYGSLPPWYSKYVFTFYDGLTCLANARQNRTDVKWIRSAEKCIQKIEKSAKISPDNHLHKLHLLLAEKAFHNENHRDAIALYDKAIDLAERNKFLLDEALACERALIFCMETIDMNFAPRYYSRASQLYREWGAHRKVHQIETMWSDKIHAFGEMSRNKRDKINAFEEMPRNKRKVAL